MRIDPFSRNTVHLAAFSREAAQDRSPGWSEAQAWVRTRAAPTPQMLPYGTPVGARGAGKQPLDSDGGSIRPVPKKYSDLDKPNH